MDLENFLDFKYLIMVPIQMIDGDTLLILKYWNISREQSMASSKNEWCRARASNESCHCFGRK